MRHPKLHFCFAHAGGTYLLLLGQIRHGYNCRPNLVGITSREYPHRTISKSTNRTSGSTIWFTIPTCCSLSARRLGRKGSLWVAIIRSYSARCRSWVRCWRTSRCAASSSHEMRAGMLAGNAVELLGLQEMFPECQFYRNNKRAPPQCNERSSIYLVL